jgi:hypothetical protein
MKNKKMIKLGNNSKFVSTMNEQKSFIQRITHMFQNFRKSISDRFKKRKK